MVGWKSRQPVAGPGLQLLVASHGLQLNRLSTVVHPLQVNYKNVMKQYSLGPNGGILTSLNLFATRFDQVGRHRLEPLLHLREPSHQAVTADTSSLLAQLAALLLSCLLVAPPAP